MHCNIGLRPLHCFFLKLHMDCTLQSKNGRTVVFLCCCTLENIFAS